MTDIDIDAIRQREQAATEGPWKTGDRFGNRSLGSSVVVLAGNLPPARLDPHRNGRNDAEFIAHARTDVPALLAKVDELTAELAKARKDRDEYAHDNTRVAGSLITANQTATFRQGVIDRHRQELGAAGEALAVVRDAHEQIERALATYDTQPTEVAR